ncbi:MAG: VRR-NUC domain-containing protein [Candidatus Omnitrophica bacterium]|jgi:hypothetical protein|nr:VRR-NUC domain-containing protein [Candidatus Omnitrophota bacterium]
MIVNDKIAKLMSEKDRKAFKILLPAERVAKLEAQSEKELQRICESELNRRNIVYLHLSFRAREKIGWPDLVFAIHGRPYAIELKTAVGKLSEVQAHTLARMKNNGWNAFVCRSFDEFLKVIGGDF